MPDMVCPTCGRKFSGLAQFCTRCGIELVNEKPLKPNKQLAESKIASGDYEMNA